VNAKSQTLKNPMTPSDSPSDSPSRVSFQKLFTVGTIGWIIASLLLFGLAWPIARPETVSNAILWSTSHWWVAFPVGLLCLVGYAMVSRSSFILAARAYLLPVAVLALIAAVCQLIYPDRSFRGDLLIFLPVVIVFYVCGCVWMALTRDKAGSSSFARAVIPAITGGLVILGLVAVPVFRSNEFRYRNTFQFTISKVALLDNLIVANGTIQIHEAGNYDFVVPRYFSLAMESGEEVDPAIEVGTIDWGVAGAPKADAKGTFPMQITWSRKLLPSTGAVFPFMDDSICLEVRDPAASADSVYSLIAEVPH